MPDQPHLAAVRSSSLSCRLADKDSCGGKFDMFLERCFYQPGQYASEEDFSALSERLSKVEKVSAASIAHAESAMCMPSHSSSLVDPYHCRQRYALGSP